ncbi:hypothetical protein FVF58_43675 [Paraburkholderia panacisoli]|uniref:Secreted protein n=1 Tax=Paraburkholderia panacisoli TaxID=2603818 RepID=A0A5B0G7I8_9BURK|nr:hypothetical protein [Paraburkholderia panacisoli]KAA0998628.1 hypothetical protein FVF58_43675 [Paraburkholderia panacisoli]
MTKRTMLLVAVLCVAFVDAAVAHGAYPKEADIMDQVSINEIAIADLLACGGAGTAAELHLLTTELPTLVKKRLDTKHLDDRVKAAVNLQTLAGKPNAQRCIAASRRWADAELETFRMLYRLEPRSD